MPTFLYLSGVRPNMMHVKYVVVDAGKLTLYLRGDDIYLDVTDQAELDRLRLYMTQHGFFRIGDTFYNPDFILYVQVDENELGAAAAYVVSTEGEVFEHSDEQELQDAIEAAPDLDWQPREHKPCLTISK